MYEQLNEGEKSKVTLCSICNKKDDCDILASMDVIAEDLKIVAEIIRCESFDFRIVEGYGNE